MIRLHLIPALLLSGCSPATAVLSGDDSTGLTEEPPGSHEADADTDADTDADISWDGAWEGELLVEFEWPTWEWSDSCTGSVELIVDGDDFEAELGCELVDAQIDAWMELSGSLSGGSGEDLLILNDGQRTDEAQWSITTSDDTIEGVITGDMLAYGEPMDYTLVFVVEQ